MRSRIKEGALQCCNKSIQCIESGAGTTVVIFSDATATSEAVATELAEHHHVLALDASSVSKAEWQEFATSLPLALAKIGVEAFSLVGVAQGVTSALVQAIYAPSQINGLILVSPPLASVQDPELNAKLKEITVPTLVLVGTRDRSGTREAGRLCRVQIPVCHLLLVYEAGQAIATDRPEACLSPIREFLTQGEGFIVTHESQLIRP